MHLSTCCRICLQNNESDGDQMFPIFDGLENICDKIKKCTGIKIQQHEKLPSFICKNCMTFLNIAYKFRSICHNSQNYLQEYVELPPSDQDKDATMDCQETLPTEQQQQCYQQQTSSQHDPMQEYVVEEIELSNTNSPSKRQLLKDESRSSVTHSEVLSEDYYDECWLEGEESTDKIASLKPSLSVRSDDNGVVKEGKDNSDANTTSKVLGISSDGTAVIEEMTLSASSKRSKKTKKPHICDICGNVYDRRYALQAHVRRHRDEKPFECEICGQAFHCNFELSRHIRKHTGVRPFVCEYCKRTFGDRSTLLKHERIHRNERPYACETCGKCFTYSSVLKVHQLTHTGEKPYNCELCGKRFSRSHHLRAHLETLQHQNDPKSKVLLKQIKRAEEAIHSGPEILSPA